MLYSHTMRTRRDRIFKIWVHLRLSYASGRDILYGISRYARANAHWNIKLMPSYGDVAEFRFPSPAEADGIISSEPLSADAAASDIPLVVIGAREKWLGRRMRSLAFVRNDDAAIGRFGAEFLKSLGKFRSFGFVPTNVPYYCSILRNEGFLAELRKATAADVRQYVARGVEDGSVDDIASLGKWLADLPKPAAVMAVHDLRSRCRSRWLSSASTTTNSSATSRPRNSPAYIQTTSGRESLLPRRFTQCSGKATRVTPGPSAAMQNP